MNHNRKVHIDEGKKKKFNWEKNVFAICRISSKLYKKKIWMERYKNEFNKKKIFEKKNKIFAFVNLIMASSLLIFTAEK